MIAKLNDEITEIGRMGVPVLKSPFFISKPLKNGDNYISEERPYCRVPKLLFVLLMSACWRFSVFIEIAFVIID